MRRKDREQFNQPPPTAHAVTDAMIAGAPFFASWFDKFLFMKDAESQPGGFCEFLFEKRI